MVKQNGSKGYKPMLAEETFLVHLYGTDTEIEQFKKIISDPNASFESLIDLVNTIKQRIPF